MFKTIAAMLATFGVMLCGEAELAEAEPGDPTGGYYREDFSGNTRFGAYEPGVAGAVVSFAVWENRDLEDHGETERNWFNDIGTTETNTEHESYWSSFTGDGFRDINKRYLDREPEGLDPSHKYLYMYQVVRHNPDVAMNCFVLPSAFELGPDGLPSVGGVNKIRKEPSVFNCTPWGRRRGTETFDGARPDRVFGDFKDTRSQGRGRIGWTDMALQMGPEQREGDEEPRWYMQAPSDVADEPGDGVPSHAGTVPINYSGMSHHTRYPTGVVRDVDAGTLTFQFEPLETAWGTSEGGRRDQAHNNLSTTSVFYATSNHPPRYQAATLVSVDGTIQSLGDVPVPSAGE